MLGAKKLKFIKSLHQRKFRQMYGNFLAEGTKTALEVLDAGLLEVEGVYGLKSWLESHGDRLPEKRELVHEVSEADLKKISALKTPNDVLLVLRQPVVRPDYTSLSKDSLLYLEEIRDPGNMGTILRIADWFGIAWVFCSEKCVERFNPKVIQASMGSFMRVHSLETGLKELRDQTGLPIVGTVLDGISVFREPLPQPAIFVIGNESLGISAETEEMLTHRISIPRHPRGGAESLNAAVATGIVCAALRHLQ